MLCPSCGELESRVLDSRPAEQGAAIRRRRQCDACRTRFTTYERAEPLLLVGKRNGRTEPFDVAKVRAGLERALADRPVPASRIDTIVEEVEAAAHLRGPLVPSTVVGTLVLERLRRLDEVAYVRFASVYKDFQDVGDFEAEVASLEKRR
ncbi:MAG TPA: transcriptional regulator NrdR [Acidimicrobiia bacterium]|nr:transcriptional regulator NrdR [Acidimicrobiia bacterium]